ncbi:MAG: hypothetical protein JWQ14_238, partial [Adhaeribacter sp.]|nr:hypothetical protein [Adhaeribacter sp.]
MTNNTHSRRHFLATLAAAGAALPFAGLATAAVPKANGAANYPVLCVFSKHLEWLPIAEMARAAKQMGFDAVDLTVRPGGHVEPQRVAEDLPKAVDIIRKAGLSVPMIATA